MNNVAYRPILKPHLSFLAALGLAAVLVGCSSTPARGPAAPATSATTAGSSAISERMPATTSTRRAIVETAAAMLGKPYQNNATGPDAFGDGGLVQYAYAQAGIDLPLSTHGQLGAGMPITLAAAEPGDLVFYQTTLAGADDSLHVGLYLNDQEMLYAAKEQGKVVIQPVTDDYWQGRLLGVVRILP
ncbi:MAG TPA: C40 family peptidase [Salinisphaeraceae bacterium]|nr:C40 family peptidase [Salinisphaeraceae bacterium]